jgi:hypothetical protein
LFSPQGGEERKEKILRKPLTLTLSRRVEREEGGRKEFNCTPHFFSLPQGERKKLREIHLIKSSLFVFVNFGVLNV